MKQKNNTTNYIATITYIDNDRKSFNPNYSMYKNLLCNNIRKCFCNEKKKKRNQQDRLYVINTFFVQENVVFAFAI